MVHFWRSYDFLWTNITVKGRLLLRLLKLHQVDWPNTINVWNGWLSRGRRPREPTMKGYWRAKERENKRRKNPRCLIIFIAKRQCRSPRLHIAVVDADGGSMFSVTIWSPRIKSSLIWTIQTYLSIVIHAKVPWT